MMDTRTLRVLSAEYRSLVEETSGELTPEVETLEKELSRKVDACAWAVDELDAEAKKWAAEEEYARQKKKQLQAAKDRLNKYVREEIQLSGRIELDGENYKAKLVRNGGVETLEIDESKLPREYFMQVITTTPDKQMIRETIKTGIAIEGASLYRGYSLRWQKKLKEIE